MNIAASSPLVRPALANDSVSFANAVSLSAVDSPMLEQVVAVNVATVNAGFASSGFASQNLLIQLRSHYPSGCLSAELVQVVAGDYVVRAIVSVDDMAIATALAAATTVEQAEDQARARVMAVLGLTPLPLTEMKLAEPKPAEIKSVIHPSDRLPDPAAIVNPPVIAVDDEVAEAEDSDAMAEAKSTVKSTRSKAKATKAKVAKSEEAVEAVEAIVEPDELSLPVVEAIVEPPAIEITGGMDDSDDMEIEYEFTVDEEPEMTAADALMADPIESMIDLSDAIAQIGAEIERIGWTRKQGSAYLQETYNKRTRAELTEPELLSFLHYLKALPSKLQPALSDLPF